MDAHFIIEQPGSSLFFYYWYIEEPFKLMKFAGVKVVAGAKKVSSQELLDLGIRDLSYMCILDCFGRPHILQYQPN